MSHELRTPISSLKWKLEELGEVVKKKEVRTGLKEVEGQVEKLHTIINTLLKVSELSSGEADYTIEDVSLTEMAKELTKEYKPRFKKKGIKYKFKKPEEDIIVKTDRYIARDALVQYLENALHYTPKDGVVELSLDLNKEKSVVRFRDQIIDLENKVVVSVYDRGEGISDTDKVKIFESFFQHGGAMKRDQEKGGLGIDLFIVKSQAKIIDADVWFESQEGVGSTFYIAFPLRD